jgi:predicted ABC-type ATPase
LSDAPFLLVIGGPNGSGKTTLTNYLLEAGVDFGEYINPDEIAAMLDLPEPVRSKQAQSIADVQRDRCLTSRISFSFETVMSHRSKVDFMIRADDAGYEVTLYFVCTADPEINIRRVENRVRRGGHDVPHERIVARYRRTLKLLPYAALVARRTVLFDNSTLVGYLANSLSPNPKAGLRPVGEVVGDGKDYEIVLESDVPAWVLDHLVNPLVELERRSDDIRLAIRQKGEWRGTT